MSYRVAKIAQVLAKSRFIWHVSLESALIIMFLATHPPENSKPRLIHQEHPPVEEEKRHFDIGNRERANHRSRPKHLVLRNSVSSDDVATEYTIVIVQTSKISAESCCPFESSPMRVVV